VYGDGDGAVQRRVRDVEGLSKMTTRSVHEGRVGAGAASLRRSGRHPGGVSAAPTPFRDLRRPGPGGHDRPHEREPRGRRPSSAAAAGDVYRHGQGRDREAQGKDDFQKALTEAAPTEVDRRMIRAFEIKPNTNSSPAAEPSRSEEVRRERAERPAVPDARHHPGPDNNVETGPRVGLNKETSPSWSCPTRAVGEIAKDDQALGDKLAEAVAKLEDMRA